MSITGAPVEAQGADAATRRPVGLLRTLAWLMIGIVAAQVGWLLAVPTFHGIDEVDHVYRAASVARGHWEAGNEVPEDGRGYLIQVPADIVAAAGEACSNLTYVGRDNCNPVSPPDDAGQVPIASAAANYNPAWYFVVGTAALPFEGERAGLAMRLASMLICNVAIAAACALLWKRYPSRWVPAGIAIAVTPVLVYSTANAAPNGLGYCAGLLLWASLLTLPRTEDEGLNAPLCGLTVAAPLVMVTHSTGLLWVTLSMLLAIPLLAGRARQLWVRNRGALICSGLTLVAASVASAAWVITAGTNDPRSGDAGEYGQVPLKTLLQGLILWPLQSIATLQMRGHAAPLATYAVGVALMIVFVYLAYRAARRNQRLVIALIAVSSLTIPLAATALAYSNLGAAWQGRYGLALSLGILVVSTDVLARRARLATLGCWAIAVALTFMQWMTLVGMFGQDISDAGRPWTPWFVISGGLVTLGAFARAFIVPGHVREAPAVPAGDEQPVGNPALRENDSRRLSQPSAG